MEREEGRRKRRERRRGRGGRTGRKERVGGGKRGKDTTGTADIARKKMQSGVYP